MQELWFHPENQYIMVYDYLEKAAGWNVRYVDLTSGLLRYLTYRGISVWPYMESITSARMDAMRDFGIHSSVSLAFNRSFLDGNEQMVELAIQLFEKDWAQSISLVGDEEKDPDVRPFQEVFRKARDAGMKTTAHAGEWAGPSSIRDTIDILSPDRIGHGVRCIEDEELIRQLIDSGTCLEVSPTSNVCTGVYPRIEEHPFSELFHRGLNVTVNSDDPPLFGTDISQEYTHLEMTFGLTDDEICKVTLNGIQSAFIPQALKTHLEGEVKQYYQENQI